MVRLKVFKFSVFLLGLLLEEGKHFSLDWILVLGLAWVLSTTNTPPLSPLLQCHSGILGGGHYVTYAKNPNSKWYCYNDSSCKVNVPDLLIKETEVSTDLEDVCWNNGFLQNYCLVTNSCPPLCNSIDCSTLGFSVHGILQARMLEWVTIFFSKGSSWTRDQTCVSCIGKQILYHWATREALSPE